MQTGGAVLKFRRDNERHADFHIANMGEMKVELTQTQKAVRGRPMTEPPEGSTVVDSVEPFAF